MASKTGRPSQPPNHPREDTARNATDSIRRRRLVIATVLALAVLLTAAVAAAAATRGYSIVYGDTLGDIAARHGTEVATLVGLNKLDDPDVIIAGDELVVPYGDLTTYTVREGDTLSGIARAYGVSIDELAAVNKISDVDLIQTGVALLIYQTPSDDATADPAGMDDSDGDDAQSDDETADVDDEAADATDSDDVDAAEDEPNGQAGQLHLVETGQTLADVAALYGVTEAQLVAANALDSPEMRVGMILKIPASDARGVELIGIPTAREQWPLMSELAAASVATAYWGKPVSADELLAALDNSDNPHLGFRGDPQGMFGTTDDYGVYSGPLAEALTSFGFTADPFYADGDRSELTRRIDAGMPVVVWITHELRLEERQVVEDELGRYSLIPGQHAVVVYGYDDSSVKVVDVATGQTVGWDWESFMASWTLFDGMGLGVKLG